MCLRLAALALAVLSGLAPALAMERPSFDCGAATGDAEKAICADPALAALDRAVDQALRAASGRLRRDPAAAAELRREQRMFNGARDRAHSERGRGLASYLNGRRDELAALVAPRAGFEGRWIANGGEAVIERRADGRYRVVLEVDEASHGAYRCAFNGLGTLEGGRMRVAWNVAQDGEDGADGWTLGLRRQGGLLRVTEQRNGSDVGRPPYCGAHGSLADVRLFPAAPKR